MSANELIIRLPLMIGVEKGMVLELEFTQANLKGWVRVVWTLEVDCFETLMRLQYTKLGDENGMARHAGSLLPRTEDCPVTHRLRVFTAISEGISDQERGMSPLPPVDYEL